MKDFIKSGVVKDKKVLNSNIDSDIPKLDVNSDDEDFEFETDMSKINEWTKSNLKLFRH